ncbi:unnamed protein product [Paramecium sonneborni]|uniref:Uncharacterized protein n=1 Tax=Paramecium sonneborni TaxID=65129 RepID=A0A8S1RPS2_9CILI|nr:unnamed protein product [Paramecium sonneborni]
MLMVITLQDGLKKGLRTQLTINYQRKQSHTQFYEFGEYFNGSKRGIWKLIYDCLTLQIIIILTQRRRLLQQQRLKGWPTSRFNSAVTLC